MKKLRLMTVFGTRPEAIKMCPLVLEMHKYPEYIEPIVAVTAQHREMLDQVLELFHIKPDYDLNIMASGQTLYDITTRALNGLKEVIEDAKPDMVLVHGDTTTTFAGALAAFYAQVPVGHVEAGLRTGNKYSPYPEEMNRQMVDRMTDMFFAPTEVSKNNLIKEDIDIAREIKLVLQPMNSQYELRKFLIENGFIIKTEDIECEGERVYNILIVEKGKICSESYDIKPDYIVTEDRIITVE